MVSTEKLNGKWFELRGISYLFGVIIRVKVVFGKTAVGTSETIAWILQPYDIRVAHKPIRQVLTNVKDKDQPHDRQGAVYRIKCTDWQAYIGETGRKMKTRLTEHKRATKNSDIRNHISEQQHKIDWDSAITAQTTNNN